MRSIPLLLFLLSVCSCAATPSSVKPADLTTEYRLNPEGIGAKAPRFAWRMEADQPAEEQTAYRIMAGISMAQLSDGRADLWDSGKVESSQSNQIAYAGKPLQSGQEVYWKVRIWNAEDHPGEWSGISLFSVGLLDESGWRAQWIGSGEDSPWLRKSFHLHHRPLSAKAYICALGYYELYINGRKVGDEVLSPARSGLYVTHDVGRYLVQGRNAVALWLGSRGDAPVVKGQMCVDHSDGQTTWIVTDHTWKAHSSPIQLMEKLPDGRYGQERYDARKEIPGWNHAVFGDRHWDDAQIVLPEPVRVSAQIVEPNMLRFPLEPSRVEQIDAETWLVDFGRSFTGWLQIQFPGEYESGHSIEVADNEYIARGRSPEIFVNRFTYHGYRRVKIKGLTDWLDKKQVLGLAVTTDYRPAGSFQCSSDLLNAIYQTTRRTFENQTLGGRLEEAGLLADTALYSYSLGAFLTQWLENRDVSLQYIMVLWEMYMHYGDRRVLEEHYPAVRELLSNGTSPVTFAERCIHLYALETARKIAVALEKADEYEKKIKALKGKLHKEFFDPVKVTYAGGRPTDLALALFSGMPPKYLHPALRNALEREIHLPSDSLETFFLLQYLMKEERNDLLHHVVVENVDPSGSTVEGRFMCLGAWLVKHIAGIRYDDRVPGFEKCIIKPAVVVGLSYAKATYRSVRGSISSHWKLEGDQLVVEVVIPPNCEAEVHIPHSMGEGGIRIEAGENAKLMSRVNDHSIYRVKPGSYRFESEWIK